VLSSLILLSIILLSSKAGILAISLILIFFIIRFILIKNKNHTLFMLTMICLFVCGNILIKSSINRITSSIAHVQQQDVTQESSNQRLQLWEQSFIIIKKNFFSGCGSGDVNDILNSELVFKYPNWNVNLNAHNQFLQVFVGTGLVGFISFLIPIYYFIIAFYRKNKIVSLLFVLLISFNMLFESMLETQAGVVFIAFFLSLLQHQYQSEKR
jgi:O-antigen ligase